MRTIKWIKFIKQVIKKRMEYNKKQIRITGYNNREKVEKLIEDNKKLDKVYNKLLEGKKNVGL